MVKSKEGNGSMREDMVYPPSVSLDWPKDGFVAPVFPAIVDATAIAKVTKPPDKGVKKKGRVVAVKGKFKRPAEGGGSLPSEAKEAGNVAECVAACVRAGASIQGPGVSVGGEVPTVHEVSQLLRAEGVAPVPQKVAPVPSTGVTVGGKGSHGGDGSLGQVGPSSSDPILDPSSKVHNKPKDKTPGPMKPKGTFGGQGSWAKTLFSGSRDETNGFKLSFVKPPANPNEDVQLDDNDEVPFTESWGFMLIGCFTGRFPGAKAVLDIVRQWRVRCKSMPYGKGWTVFRFESEVEMEKVLMGGPYMAFGKTLLLKKVEGNTLLHDDMFMKVPVWVQFHRVPMSYWSASGISKIASKVGCPLYSDQFTKDRSKVAFARALVEVDIGKEPVMEFGVALPYGQRYVQRVEYENFPDFCFHCRVWGHHHATCKVLHPELQKPEPRVLPTDTGKGSRGSNPRGSNTRTQHTAGEPRADPTPSNGGHTAGEPRAHPGKGKHAKGTKVGTRVKKVSSRVQPTAGEPRADLQVKPLDRELTAGDPQAHPPISCAIIGAAPMDILTEGNAHVEGMDILVDGSTLGEDAPPFDVSGMDWTIATGKKRNKKSGANSSRGGAISPKGFQ